jgi:hypothetical protein
MGPSAVVEKPMEIMDSNDKKDKKNIGVKQ